MSRIRTIKPEFWASEQIIACSLNARLLFIGIWNFSDDSGVHPTSYVRLKAEIFPGDDFTPENIKTWVHELIKNGLIREYTIEEKGYWIVTGWKKNQYIDRPKPRHPLPQSELKKISDNSTSPRREVDESSTNTPRIIDEPSTTEGNGRDRKGMDIDLREVETSPVDVLIPNSSASTQVFQHWQTVMKHPGAKLDEKRQRKINQALKLGYSVIDLKQAIDGCAKTPYNMGKNDNGQVFDDIGLILRDAEHIERFINNATGLSVGTKSTGDATTDIMAGVL